jgi:GNAT superfamily N-acetyltransferase
MRATQPSSYRIRPIAASDRDDLSEFYARLASDSREARFHGAAPGIGETTARFFCGPDHEHREGIVAEAVDVAGQRRIVGHLCLEPIDTAEVELAIAVADAWQRHGVGRAMLAEAVRWAVLHRVTRLRASVDGQYSGHGLIHPWAGRSTCRPRTLAWSTSSSGWGTRRARCGLTAATAARRVRFSSAA